MKIAVLGIDLGKNVCSVVGLDASGAVVLKALESGVSKVPASAGQFPQISGMTMTVL